MQLWPLLLLFGAQDKLTGALSAPRSRDMVHKNRMTKSYASSSHHQISLQETAPKPPTIDRGYPGFISLCVCAFNVHIPVSLCARLCAWLCARLCAWLCAWLCASLPPRLCVIVSTVTRVAIPALRENDVCFCGRQSDSARVA